MKETTMTIIEPKTPNEITLIPLQQVFEEAIRDEIDIKNYYFQLDKIADILLRSTSVIQCRFVKCHFISCVFDQLHLIDVAFENCDLSNIRFNGCIFNRVSFKSCKLMGSTFTKCRFDNVSINDSVGNYANFLLAEIRNSSFYNTNFAEVVFTESKFNKTILEKCCFERANFMHADLKDIDFSDCNIDSAYFMLDKLKGITVSFEQAVEFAKMIDLKVK